MARREKITTSSTAEYFSKNLQQVGFSSPTKAVLTTLKEAVDNSLDACEAAGILPDIVVEIEKKGAGTIRNTDLIRIAVEDNGPGLELDDVSKVFGEYLASSKFGRGRCSRGQQGIGISAATTWAQLTSARGATVMTKTKRMRKAIRTVVEVDIKNNRGILKKKEPIEWKKDSGVRVEFFVDGRLQLNGEGGILTYLLGNTLVNPHLNLKYTVGDQPTVDVKRVSTDCPQAPPATEPHPHTMKLGEFIAHSHLYGRVTVRKWLKTGFSRVTENVIAGFIENGLNKKLLEKRVDTVSQIEFKEIFAAVHKTDLMAPSTRSVMTIGEEAFSKSIMRLGEIDFFSVVTRKPKICDFKPVAVEVAIARLKKGGDKMVGETDDSPVTVLRFANRVPLQFDKAACAMVKAIQTVSWRTYGLSQPKGSLPMGPYIFAVSLVSPFIKFKNASKETVDASDDLVEELRRALIQGGQRLSRHIKKEAREAALEQKKSHIEQFCPILVDCLCRITEASDKRKKKASEGLARILDGEVSVAQRQVKDAKERLAQARAKGKVHVVPDENEVTPDDDQPDLAVELTKEAGSKPAGKKSKKKTSKAKTSKKKSSKAKSAKKAKSTKKAKKTKKGKKR